MNRYLSALTGSRNKEVTSVGDFCLDARSLLIASAVGLTPADVQQRVVVREHQHALRSSSWILRPVCERVQTSFD